MRCFADDGSEGGTAIFGTPVFTSLWLARSRMVYENVIVERLNEAPESLRLHGNGGFWALPTFSSIILSHT